MMEGLVSKEEEIIGSSIPIPVTPIRKTASRIFEEYRTLGYVSNHVPCMIRYVHTRRENFIVTCNGKAFNTYVGQQLKLISVGGMAQEEINCMTTDTYHVYTGVQNKIYAWRRGIELKHVYEGSKDDIIHLLAFGDNLVSIDEGGEMLVRNIKTTDIIRRLQFKTENFKPTVLMHPLSFQNKILLGSSQGVIQLWNIDRAHLVHQFDRFKGNCINSIVQAPSVGVVAVALSGKNISLFNFEYDLIIMTLECLDEPVSIAFRLDDIPVMVAGSKRGSITAWNLEKKEVICYAKEAHQHSVTGIVSFMKEPLFISSSADNSVKVWIFDKPDGGFRLLNSRDGHRLPPRMIKFHGEKEANILSVGDDKCMRSFHLHNETYNRTISNFLPNSEDEKGRGVPMNNFVTVSGFNPAIAEDIVGCNYPIGREVYTFSFESANRGKNLELPKFTGKVVSSLCITSCSQFAIVGFQSGNLHLYNIQSKKLRIEYIENNSAHTKEITGIAVDSINSVIVSGGLDQYLKFWDFGKGKLMHSINCEATVERLFFRRNSNLFGVIMNSFEIWVCDISTFDIVRKLEGCCHPIAVACLSPNCRWVTAATEDGCLRTWDVPTAHLVDIFRVVDGLVTSLEYSPNGEFLATTFSGDLGILLWMNKTVYQHVSLQPIPVDYEPDYNTACYEPQVSPIPDDELPNQEFFLDQDKLYGLAVLASASYHRWKDLLHLSTIKERNKPKAPVKQATVPFMFGSSMEIFPTTNGVESSSVVQSESNIQIKNGKEPMELDDIVNIEEEDDMLPPKAKILKLDSTLSPFATKLSLNSDRELHYQELIKMLENMGPSRVDLEIRSLGPESGGSVELLEKFIKLILYHCQTYSHFETVHSYLGLFLQVYYDLLPTSEELIKSLQALRQCIKVQEDKLSKQTNKIISLSDFAKSILF